MGRRLRGAGSPSARAMEEPGERATWEATTSRDFWDRISAVRSRTGETNGQIIERLAGPQLTGIRVASVPDRLMPPGWRTPSVGGSEPGEAGENVSTQCGQVGESLTSADPSPLVPLGGGEQAARGPLPAVKLSTEQAAQVARARKGQQPGRKAS